MEFYTLYIQPVVLGFLGAFIGWLASLFLSYFNEKGKNLATKEDIAEITLKIESVKQDFHNKSLRSKIFIENQVKAYEELDQLLYRFIQMFFAFNENEGIKNIDIYQDKIILSNKNWHQELIRTYEKNSIHISDDVKSGIVKIVRKCVTHSKKFNRKSAKKRVLTSLDEIYDMVRLLRSSLKKELIT